MKHIAKSLVEQEWRVWKNGIVPIGYWSKWENQRKYFDWLSEELNITHQEQWYSVNIDSIRKIPGSGGILQHFENSLVTALLEVYPQYLWLPWKFTKSPQHYWKKKENRRQYFDWIAEELQLNSLQDWYGVSTGEVIERGGSALIGYYKGSLSKALSELYPEVEWHPWKFNHLPKDYWKDVSNQKQFFEYCKEQLKIREPEDWYNINLSDVRKLGGRRLLSEIYSNNLCAALERVYPEHNWLAWKFPSVPAGFWSQHSNLKKYVEWLGEQLHITELSDWKRVSYDDLRTLKGHYVVYKFGGLVNLLTKVYPHHSWTSFHLLGSSKSELLMFQYSKQLFPVLEVLKRYQFVKMDKSTAEVDVFLPSISLALEYHGIQHYHWTDYFGSPEGIQRKDEEKRKLCKDQGITLVEIPFWWDHTKSSLAATIHLHRPDLLQYADGVPIPTTPPEEEMKKVQRKILPKPQSTTR